MKINAQINQIVTKEGNLKAYASVNFDDCFAVRNLKVFEGKNGLFVNMPSVKNAKGEYKDICFPTNAEFRSELNNAVIGAYQKAILELQNSLQQQASVNFTQAESNDFESHFDFAM